MNPQSQIEAVQRVVTEVLQESDGGDPTSVVHTFLIRGGFFAGHKFRFDGGWAVWLTGSQTVEVYAEDGTLRKTVNLGTSDKPSTSRKTA
jgi:hypothetical protein